MIILLSAAAFSAGAVTALYIDLRLIISYLLVMILPPILIIVFLHTPESTASALIFSVYLLFLISIAWRLNGEYWQMLNTIHSSKKQVMGLKRENENLESYAYSISHELRTPLRIIDGFCRLLREEIFENLTKGEQNYFQRIQGSVDRMGDLIDDILQLSRISKNELTSVSTNLSALVVDNIEKMQLLEPDRKVDIRIEPDVYTIGDKSLLDIVIQNLVSNAWKYSGKTTQTRIYFGTVFIDKKLSYYIQDNGAGFEEQMNSQLFTPFGRMSNSNEYPGSGLGLSIVERIVNLHGGKVWAEAELNRGATFYFTLQDSNIAPQAECLHK